MLNIFEAIVKDEFNNYWLKVKNESDGNKIKDILKKHFKDDVDVFVDNKVDVFIVLKDPIKLSVLQQLLKGVKYKIKDKTLFNLK